MCIMVVSGWTKGKCESPRDREDMGLGLLPIFIVISDEIEDM